MADQITLDAQQSAAVTVGENVVVSAGAGSGKTRVLTERYTALVQAGAEIGSILTLTFTRKAAAEMFQRIYRRLGEVAGGDAHVQRQMERFDEAQISTLDSFCAAVLRDVAPRFGLPPAVQTDEDELHRAMRSLALRLLTDYGDHPILGAYVRQYGISGTLDKLLLPLALRVFRVSRPLDFDQLLIQQDRWLQQERTRLEARIQDQVDAVVGFETDREKTRAYQNALSQRREDPASLAEFLRTEPRNGLPRGAEGAAIKELIDSLWDKTRKDGTVVDWLAVTTTGDQREELSALYRVLAQFQERVLDYRRRRGLLTYQEVMELAVQALRDDYRLRRAYKQRYRTIMIDEFQDNNETQRDLLFLLAEQPEVFRPHVPQGTDLAPNRLFFVGDQKQSIYRFRGADVAVFRSLADTYRTLELSTNYRSRPALIRFFNAFFPRVFGEVREPWEAEFQPLQHREETAEEKADRSPPVTLAVVAPTKEQEDSREEPLADLVLSEAGWIADEIRRLTQGDHPYQYRDIAVLFRSTGNQQKLERMLRRRGIPYHAQAVRSLFTEAPASDLYSLLQLAFYPEDTEALAAYLRSPLVMLSDEAVVRLLISPVRLDRDAAASQVALSVQDGKKLDAAVGLYRAVQESLDRRPLPEVLRMIWEDSGYRYSLLHRSSDHGYLEHLSYLNALSERYAQRPAIEFVDYLRRQMGQTEKIDELETSADDNRVQLMTIHKSKGLEFPVVFLFGLGGGVGVDQGILWIDRTQGFSLRLPDRRPGERPVNAFARYGKRQDQREDAAELKRLAYVAMTRAEERLYATAALGNRNSQRPLWDLLAPALGLARDDLTLAPEFNSLVQVESIPALTQRELREHHIPQDARRSAAEAQALLDAAGLRHYRSQEVEFTPSGINQVYLSTQGPGSVPEETGDGQGAALLGTVTHALLEYRAAEDLTREDWLAAPPWLDRHLTAGQETAVDRELLNEAWDLAERFFSSEFAQSLKDGRWEPELSFVLSLADPEVTISGTMDLVVELPEQVWVVDYKTDRSLDPQHYAGQMAVYRRAAFGLFGKTVELRVFGLREGTAHSVVDPELSVEDFVRLLQHPAAGVGL